MARLTSPTGITVNVSDEKAAQLASIGYVAEGEKLDKKPSSRRSTTKKTAEKSSDES